MRKLSIVVTAALVLIGGIVAAAVALPGSDGIEACYHARSGDLRVDVDGSGCRAMEHAVTLGDGLVTRKVVASDVVPPDSMGSVVALCDPGEVVLGGGHQQASINPEVVIVTDAPHLVGTDQGWLVSATNPTELYDLEIWAFAICAPGTSTQFE